MMKHTQHTIKTPHKAIIGLLCAFILVFGIGFGISRVEASNPYIENIVFYKNDTDNFAHIKFFCKTSFTFTGGIGNFGSIYQDPEILKDFGSPCGTQNYTAGNTYDFALYRSAYCSPPTPDPPFTNEYYFTNIGLTGANPFTPNFTDTEKYYFSEKPTLDISYPLNNAEIVEAFNITGTYTIPENSGITKLIAFFTPVGLPYSTYSFHQNLTYLSGDVNIRSSGIQADDYTIEFCFVGFGIEAICPVENYINISIVERIPPELPETQEPPPEFYDPIDADQFYLDFSAYDTPTAMYNNLKSAIQPIFITIGSNLTFFTSRFDSETAKDTGEKTGQAILLVRSYSSNLNTFFNDLPVSEFLLFYLTLLIVVIVFRIIKNLINLIKP